MTVKNRTLRCKVKIIELSRILRNSENFVSFQGDPPILSFVYNF